MQLPGPSRMSTPRQVHGGQIGLPGQCPGQQQRGELHWPDGGHVQGEALWPQAGLQKVRIQNKHNTSRTHLETEGPGEGPQN